MSDSLDDCLVGVAGACELLADTADDEDFVVHGQAEEDGEEHHGHKADDGDGSVEADELVADAFLEDSGDDSVGGEHRQDIEESGLQRYEDRAEGDDEQDQGERHDGPDEQGKPTADALRHVDVGGGRTGHVGLGLGAAQRGGQYVVAHTVDEGPRGLILRRGPGDRGQDRGGAVAVGQGLADRCDVAVVPGGCSYLVAAPVSAGASGALTTMVSGPLKPGPKAVASRS